MAGGILQEAECHGDPQRAHNSHGEFRARVGSRMKAPHSQCRNYHVLDKDALGHAELRLLPEWCKATSSKKRLSGSGRRQRGLCLPTRFLGHRERVGEDEAI